MLERRKHQIRGLDLAPVRWETPVQQGGESRNASSLRSSACTLVVPDNPNMILFPESSSALVLPELFLEIKLWKILLFQLC